MKIIDAHHHLWDLDTGRYPWLQSDETEGGFVGDISPLQSTYSVRAYCTDIGGLNVVKSVHVQAEYDVTDPVAETRWLQSQADANGFPHAIVAFADFSQPEVERTLEQHAEHSNLRGVRQILSHHPEPAYCHAEREFLNDTEWVKRIGLLKSHDWSFDLQIYPHQVTDALPVIDSHPNTLFIVNHALEPWSASIELQEIWRAGVRALAMRPNTAMKISGFAMFLRPFHTATIRPYVLELIDTFGADRCMFGSNFPVDKLHCSYHQIFSAFDAITQDFSDTDRAALFSGTAASLYDL